MKEATISTQTQDGKRSVSVQHKEAESFTDLQKLDEGVVVYHYNKSVKEALTGALKNHLVSRNGDRKFVYTPEQIAQLEKFNPYVPSIPAQRQTPVDKTQSAIGKMNPADQERIREYLNKVASGQK